MKSYSKSFVVTVAILMCCSIGAAFGQERSTDRDKPTPLTSNKVDDDLDGSDSTYFYKFTAGPGKLTLTFEVKASGTNAGAMLALFDARSRPLLSDVLAQGVDGGSERQVNSVQLRSKQELLLSIKGLKYGDSGGTGTYTVTLDGPVVVSQGAPPAPAPAPAGNNAPAAGNGGGAAPAASNLWSGQLDPTDERLLFRNVNVSGPGQVTFSFNVKATDAQAGAKFAVVTEQGTQPLDAIELQGGEGISKPVTFDKAQPLLIMVQVAKFPGNVGRGSYSVQLSGPAEFAGGPPNGSNPLSGELEPTERLPRFHFMNVNGPGQVTFTFSVKATDAKAGARIAVLAQNGRPPLPPLEVQGGESITKPVTFDKPQTITILIQAIKPPDNGGGKGTYSIQVSGPVTVVR